MVVARDVRQKVAVALGLVLLVALAANWARLTWESRDEPAVVRPRPGSPPVRISQGRWTCTEPFWAYVDKKVFYREDHPSLPALDRMKPTRCFESSEAAVEAGYRSAVLTRRWTFIAGAYVYGGPLNHSLREDCRAASRRLASPVPCPRFLSVADYGATTCPLAETPCRRGATFAIWGRPFSFGPEPSAPQGNFQIEVLSGYPKGLAPARCRGRRTDQRANIRDTQITLTLCEERQRTNQPGYIWVSTPWEVAGIKIDLRIRMQVLDSQIVPDLFDRLAKLAYYFARNIILVRA